MNTTPRDLGPLIELARRDAPRLRREAIAAFWADLARRLAAALRPLRHKIA